MMRSACTETGALMTEPAAFAAAYVCYMYERFCKERSFDTYRGRYTEMKSPWELNTLTKARFGRIVPFGAAGYAYVSKSLRNARGAPAYLRAEPPRQPRGCQYSLRVTRGSTARVLSQVCCVGRDRRMCLSRWSRSAVGQDE